MIAAFDVHYPGDGHASAAAVLFRDYSDATPSSAYTHLRKGIADYIPGQFYKRELPCLLGLINKIDESLDELIVDGYVHHSDGPGLGQHLYMAISGRIPVIGVAKSKYRHAKGIEVLRGKSRRPLYITSAGLDHTAAAARIHRMHGRHRIPTLLRQVDHLAREMATAKDP